LLVRPLELVCFFADGLALSFAFAPGELPAASGAATLACAAIGETAISAASTPASHRDRIESRAKPVIGEVAAILISL